MCTWMDAMGEEAEEQEKEQVEKTIPEQNGAFAPWGLGLLLPHSPAWQVAQLFVLRVVHGCAAQLPPCVFL